MGKFRKIWLKYFLTAMLLILLQVIGWLLYFLLVPALSIILIALALSALIVALDEGLEKISGNTLYGYVADWFAGYGDDADDGLEVCDTDEDFVKENGDPIPNPA
ncbi:MAG: hypothetical protein WCY49_07425 [Anaerovoracaceae bacterium]